MWVWDYQLSKDWQPRTDKEWEWFLVRKLNYGDFQGLKKDIIKKYFRQIQKQLDPGIRAMFVYYFSEQY